MKIRKTVAAILAALMMSACGGDKVMVDEAPDFVENELESAPETGTPVAETVTAGAETDAEDGEPSENADAYDEPAAVTAVSVMDSIKAAVELPEMYAADDAYLLNNYGIDPATLDSYAIEEALEVTRADRIILIDPAEGTDTASVSEKLEAFRQDKAMEMQDYLPEQYEVIAAASVKEIGSFICLVISPDAENIENIIGSMTGK